MKQDKSNLKTKAEEVEDIKEIDIEWNNRTYQSYIDNGFTPPDNLDMVERKFLSRVDTSGKYPVLRQVTRIIRLKSRDPKTRQDKEYLVYYENWSGRDWLGRKVPVVAEHMEGMYWEEDSEPNIVYGDNGPMRKGVIRSGQHKVYYIPFSKEKVDEIIANSPDTYKEDLRYCVKFDDSTRDDRFTYE